MFVVSVPDSELKSRPDTKDFGLKQIEGTGLSMSACREIAVSTKTTFFSKIQFSVKNKRSFKICSYCEN